MSKRIDTRPDIDAIAKLRAWLVLVEHNTVQTAWFDAPDVAPLVLAAAVAARCLEARVEPVCSETGNLQ
jgi:hypothetical protein